MSEGDLNSSSGTPEMLTAAYLSTLTLDQIQALGNERLEAMPRYELLEWMLKRLPIELEKLGPWDSPSFDTSQVSSKDDDLYIVVGEAINAWEYAESAFAHLFSELVEADSEASSRVYGGIQSSTGRVEAIRNAAEVYFHEHSNMLGYKTILSQLTNHINKASSRRNDIVHGRLSNIPKIGFYWTSTLYNTRKTQYVSYPKLIAEENQNTDSIFVENFILQTLMTDLKRIKYAYSAIQIKEFSDRFRFLGQIVLRINWRFILYRMLFSKENNRKFDLKSVMKLLPR